MNRAITMSAAVLVAFVAACQEETTSENRGPRVVVRSSDDAPLAATPSEIAQGGLDGESFGPAGSDPEIVILSSAESLEPAAKKKVRQPDEGPKVIYETVYVYESPTPEPEPEPEAELEAPDVVPAEEIVLAEPEAETIPEPTATESPEPEPTEAPATFPSDGSRTRDAAVGAAIGATIGAIIGGRRGAIAGGIGGAIGGATGGRGGIFGGIGGDDPVCRMTDFASPRYGNFTRRDVIVRPGRGFRPGSRSNRSLSTFYRF